jgi:hypothetical protein
MTSRRGVAGQGSAELATVLPEPAKARRPGDCLGRAIRPERATGRGESAIRGSTREAKDHGRVAKRVALSQETQELPHLRVDFGGISCLPQPVINWAEATKVVDQSIDHGPLGGGLREDALAGERREQGRSGVRIR